MRGRWHCAGWFLVVLAAPSAAQSISLEPVTVVLRPEEQSTTVWLSNDGAHPFKGRATMYAWRQEQGEEQLDDTGQLAVSPQKLEVPPGGRQRLRVVRPEGMTAEAAERAFRLIIAQKPAEGDTAPAAEYSLPVFAMPPGQEAPRLLASVEATEGGEARLRIQNNGFFHVKLMDLAFRESGHAEQMLVPGLAGYVLPGSYKHWTLPATARDFRKGDVEVTANGVAMTIRLVDSP